VLVVQAAEIFSEVVRLKVFISWSGDRSRVAALALREWLPLVLHYVQPWLSDRDIAAGERWAVEIGRELEGTQFGLIVLTSDNLSAPWILFEAGALSKAFTASHVCPYLIDLEFKDVSGPLSQFQAKKSDRVSTLELLESVNAKAQTPIDGQRLAELFDALWPRLEARLKAIPVAKGPEAKARSQAQVLEELVVATRRMEARLDAFTSHNPLEPPSRQPMIDVLLRTKIPSLKDAQAVSFEVRKNVIDEVAKICGLEVGDYGKSWMLKRHGTERLVSKTEGAFLARRATRLPLRLVLETVPVDQPSEKSANVNAEPELQG